MCSHNHGNPDQSLGTRRAVADGGRPPPDHVPPAGAFEAPDLSSRGRSNLTASVRKTHFIKFASVREWAKAERGRTASRGVVCNCRERASVSVYTRGATCAAAAAAHSLSISSVRYYFQMRGVPQLIHFRLHLKTYLLRQFEIFLVLLKQTY